MSSVFDEKSKATTLATDEKTTLVMIYTTNALIRGEAITKENIRISIWLRTQGAPEYVHLLKAQVILFGGVGPIKPQTYSELFVPTSQILGFHMAPPASDPVDYDESEKNRMMEPVTVLIGTFRLQGHLRISSQASASTALEVSRSAFLSFYDIQISCDSLPGMGAIKVPMMLIRPNNILFGLHT